MIKTLHLKDSESMAYRASGEELRQQVMSGNLSSIEVRQIGELKRFEAASQLEDLGIAAEDVDDPLEFVMRKLIAGHKERSSLKVRMGNLVRRLSSFELLTSDTLMDAIAIALKTEDRTEREQWIELMLSNLKNLVLSTAKLLSMDGEAGWNALHWVTEMKAGLKLMGDVNKEDRKTIEGMLQSLTNQMGIEWDPVYPYAQPSWRQAKPDTE